MTTNYKIIICMFFRKAFPFFEMSLLLHFPFCLLAREPNWRTMGTAQSPDGTKKSTIHLAEGRDKEL